MRKELADSYRKYMTEKTAKAQKDMRKSQRGWFEDPGAGKTGWSYSSGRGDVARNVQQPTGFEKVITGGLESRDPETQRMRARSYGPKSESVVPLLVAPTLASLGFQQAFSPLKGGPSMEGRTNAQKTLMEQGGKWKPDPDFSYADALKSGATWLPRTMWTGAGGGDLGALFRGDLKGYEAGKPSTGEQLWAASTFGFPFPGSSTAGGGIKKGIKKVAARKKPSGGPKLEALAGADTVMDTMAARRPAIEVPRGGFTTKNFMELMVPKGGTQKLLGSGGTKSMDETIGALDPSYVEYLAPGSGSVGQALASAVRGTGKGAGKKGAKSSAGTKAPAMKPAAAVAPRIEAANQARLKVQALEEMFNAVAEKQRGLLRSLDPPANRGEVQYVKDVLVRRGNIDPNKSIADMVKKLRAHNAKKAAPAAAPVTAPVVKAATTKPPAAKPVAEPPTEKYTRTGGKRSEPTAPPKSSGVTSNEAKAVAARAKVAKKVDDMVARDTNKLEKINATPEEISFVVNTLKKRDQVNKSNSIAKMVEAVRKSEAEGKQLLPRNAATEAVPTPAPSRVSDLTKADMERIETGSKQAAATTKKAVAKKPATKKPVSKKDKVKKRAASKKDQKKTGKNTLGKESRENIGIGQKRVRPARVPKSSIKNDKVTGKTTLKELDEQAAKADKEAKIKKDSKKKRARPSGK